MLKKDNFLWIISAIISLTFFILIALSWYQSTSAYKPESDRINSTAEVTQFLQKHWQKQPITQFPIPTTYIPTGIYIQTLFFVNPYTVQLTGFIWQRFNKVAHQGLPRDFVFPDAIEAAKTNKRIVYRQDSGDHELIGWHFETLLRQNFSYSKYPLDHKTISIRIWPYGFNANAILIPDFASYLSTKPGTIFGISDQITLPNFYLRDTFFRYVLTNYDSSFGLLHIKGQKGYPDLSFNLVITRKVLQGIVFHILPLTAVLLLLFLLLLVTTHDANKLEFYKSSTAGNIGGAGALFFVLVLANIRVREQFAGSDIVYIEYYFLLAYFMIVCVALNSFLFNATKKSFLIQYHDNLIPKLLYWPLVLGVLLIITLIVV